MPNVSLTAIVSATGSPGNFSAQTIQSNFEEIRDGVNSNALDSANYGISSVESKNVSHSAIVSAVISNTAVVEAKVSDNAVVNRHTLRGNDGSLEGIRVLGASITGLKFARWSSTVAETNNPLTSSSFQVVFSDCADGNPGFTTTPTPIGWWDLDGSAIAYGGDIDEQAVANVTSSSLDLVWTPRSAHTSTRTIHVYVAGK